jgi:DNA repair protein RecN (Recombination protein N)
MPKPVLLTSLQVKNLGVLKDVLVEFDAGFTVLTGETGAGKTLLVDALELARGSDMRLDAASMAPFSVTALFHSAGGEVLLGRELGDSRRLRATIDGHVASAETVARAAERLFTIHGQKTASRVSNRQWHRDVVDQFGAVDTSEWNDLTGARQRLLHEHATLATDPLAREREKDYLRFQIAEWERLRVNDPSELVTLIRELEDLTERRDATASIHLTSESLSMDGGPVEEIARLLKNLPRGDSLMAVRGALEGSLELLRDASSSLRALVDEDGTMDERIAEVEQRVGDLTRFARKYGGSLHDAATDVEKAREKLRNLEEGESKYEQYSRELGDLEARIAQCAARLFSDRQRAAQQLAASVNDVLPRVALPHGRIGVSVSGTAGAEMELTYQPHRDAPVGALGDMASGGELSRVMLALTLVSLADNAVAVFDEVDAGIGGSTAQSIGDCLLALSQYQQVIAVTHTASIAAKAGSHWVVEKSADGSSASLRRVEGLEREREIARMLSGDSDSPESRALARQLLA